MIITDMAGHLGVSRDVIKKIQKRYLKRRYSRRKLKHLKQFVIDEITISPTYGYLTMILDPKSGAVFLQEKKRSLMSFFHSSSASNFLKPKRKQWLWTCLQPTSAPSPKTCQQPKAAFNHFRVIKLHDEELDGFRRKLNWEADTALHKRALKATR